MGRMHAHNEWMVETLRLQIAPDALGSPESQSAVKRVAGIWRAGGVVAFPTETVYGLGANALDAAAVAKIFAAKQRPAWDPLIVHVTDQTMLGRVAGAFSPTAQALAEAFWPGPLTLLLPRTVEVPDAVTAGRALVGVRMPAHPVARALIAAADLPIAAPSANSFGRASPSSAVHVLEDLEGRIDAVVDGGATTHGLESTVVDASGEVPVVYRQGMISLEQLRVVAGRVELYRQPPAMGVDGKPEALPSPGVGIRHYAPRARLLLIENDGGAAEQRNAFLRTLGGLPQGAGAIGVMLPLDWPLPGAAGRIVYRWGRWEDTEELARRLFAGLRELDARGAAQIICPVPADTGLGAAIADRLRKAARPR